MSRVLCFPKRSPIQVPTCYLTSVRSLRPMLLHFGDQTRTGVFKVIWQIKLFIGYSLKMLVPYMKLC